MTTARSQPSTGAPGGVDRAKVHQRTLHTLWASAVFSRGATSAIFPVSVLAIKEILGSSTWAGLSTGFTSIGSAISAVSLAALMQRRGRNLGITTGFGVAILGAALAIVAIEADTLVLFLVSMLLVGVGSGTSNLSRYAATDLAPEDRRSRDLSTVIFASTFGAVLFPLFIGVAGDLAEDMGFDENAGGFALGLVLFALATAAVWFFMRPDPLVVAGGIVSSGSSEQKAVPFREAAAIAWARPLSRLAFATLFVSQVVMVMVMAMTPLHMDDHEHTKSVIGQVISGHTAGMFALAPVAGWLSDKVGRIPTIALAGFTFVVATVMTAFAHDAPLLLMFPGLFLLGLGWSFGIVAGSALLTESVAEGDRVAVQGAADSAMTVGSGVGALGSGIVLSAFGFMWLSIMGLVAGAALLTWGLVTRSPQDAAHPD